MNASLWNQAAFAEKAAQQPERLAQSKGKARMKAMPRRGDTVDFVLKGKIIMRGIVESDGFLSGTLHQRDTFNLGEERPHAEVNEFAMIKEIRLLAEPIAVPFTGQRTWLKTKPTWPHA